MLMLYLCATDQSARVDTANLRGIAVGPLPKCLHRTLVLDGAEVKDFDWEGCEHRMTTRRSNLRLVGQDQDSEFCEQIEAWIIISNYRVYYGRGHYFEKSLVHMGICNLLFEELTTSTWRVLFWTTRLNKRTLIITLLVTLLYHSTNVGGSGRKWYWDFSDIVEVLDLTLVNLRQMIRPRLHMHEHTLAAHTSCTH
jgi:hypothetical protein